MKTIYEIYYECASDMPPKWGTVVRFKRVYSDKDEALYAMYELKKSERVLKIWIEESKV